MSKIAMLTTGHLKTNLDTSNTQDFISLSNQIFAQLPLSEGYLGGTASMGVAETSDRWGAWAVPKMYAGYQSHAGMLQTLSLWKSLEAMVAYSYHGRHKEGLQRKDEWFDKLPLPNHAIWWLDDNASVTWEVAVAKYDKIEAEGPQPDTFNMRQLFDGAGNPVKLNRERLQIEIKPFK